MVVLCGDCPEDESAASSRVMINRFRCLDFARTGHQRSVMKRLAKMARTPMTAAAWWAALWAWRNRPWVSQWAHFGWQAIRTRRSPRDVALEVRVRGALARDPAIRRSSEVQVDSVRNHVVHLVGVPGGEDTERAALAVARVRGVTAVDLHDKVALVDRDGAVVSSAVV